MEQRANTDCSPSRAGFLSCTILLSLSKFYFLSNNFDQHFQIIIEGELHNEINSLNESCSSNLSAFLAVDEISLESKRDFCENSLSKFVWFLQLLLNCFNSIHQILSFTKIFWKFVTIINLYLLTQKFLIIINFFQNILIKSMKIKAKSWIASLNLKMKIKQTANGLQAVLLVCFQTGLL